MSSTKENLLAFISNKISPWFQKNEWTAFPFQKEAWQKYAEGFSGIVNAPTGSGKTYSLLLPIILEGQFLEKTTGKKNKGLQVIWITPIRALSKEIEQSAKRALLALGSNWEVQTRTGDTSTKVKNQQKTKLSFAKKMSLREDITLARSKLESDLADILSEQQISSWKELNKAAQQKFRRKLRNKIT